MNASASAAAPQVLAAPSRRSFNPKQVPGIYPGVSVCFQLSPSWAHTRTTTVEPNKSCAHMYARHMHVHVCMRDTRTEIQWPAGARASENDSTSGSLRGGGRVNSSCMRSRQRAEIPCGGSSSSASSASAALHLGLAHLHTKQVALIELRRAKFARSGAAR